MSGCTSGGPLKILVFATQNCSLAARISIALDCVGFHVAALTRRGHCARQTRRIRQYFAYDAHFSLESITRAINRWNPHLIVCTDDFAVGQLQTLHQRSAASRDKVGKRLCDLIELSLGAPTSFPAVRNKSEFLELAEREGLRCPKTIVIPATRTFDSAPPKLSYPIVVKADQSDGGRCVRVVNSEAELRSAVWELQTPSTWRSRRFFGAMLGSEALKPLMLPLRRTISLQEYIVGRPSNRAVICWKGKVLAGISVEAVEETYEYGPASVVRLIDHAEMAMVCEHMVKRLHLSGFVGFDFILDSANRAWLLEMNPRVTQTCHFFLAGGTNLAGPLYTQMNGQLPPSRPAPINGDLIALFPNEIMRSPSSSYLRSCQHDVPWEEPKLVCGELNRVLRTGTARRVRSFLEYYFPSVVGALVKLGLVDGHARQNSPAFSRADAASFVLPLQDSFADRERTAG
jgi:ATP-grasp domain